LKFHVDSIRVLTDAGADWADLNLDDKVGAE
jgi:hypothetical protein